MDNMIYDSPASPMGEFGEAEPVALMAMDEYGEPIELTEEEQEAIIEAARVAAEKRQTLLDNLAAFVENDYECKRTARASKKDQWIRSLALYNSPLADPFMDNSVENRVFGEGSKNKSETANPYPNIVRSRCKNVISELIQGQFATGDNWGYKASPIMDELSVSPDIYGMAEETAHRAQRMEATVRDQLGDCGYTREYKRAIEDFVILGTGILKGPRNSSKYRKTYIQEMAEDGTPVYIPTIVPIPRPGVWRVEPWFFFPDFTTNDSFKLESAIEVHPTTRTEMQTYLRHQAFLPDQVSQALELGPSGSEDEIFDFFSVSETGSSTPDNKFIIKEFHGPIKVKTLLELETEGLEGISEDDYDSEETILAEVWVANGKTIRVSLPVLEEESEIPYAVAAYEADPSCVLGFSLPLLLESQQRIVKTATQLLLDNAAITSGPQVAIDKSKISSEGIGKDNAIRPWKVWVKNEYSADGGGVEDAIQFFNVPSMADHLSGLISVSSNDWAASDSGVNEMVGGLMSPQGMETGSATGMALANHNAMTPLLYKQEILIENLTARVARWMYDWNMQYNMDSSIKGDFEIDVTTPIKNIKAQQEKIDMERLLMQTNQDPEVGTWVKKDALVRWYLAGMSLPSEEFIRSPEERQAFVEEQAENQGPDPAMLKAEAEMMVAETKQREVEIDGQRLEFDREQGHMQAEMEYMRYMENQQTRIQEAEARLLAEQLKRETKMIELAIRSETERARVMAELQKNDLNKQVELFRAGQDAELKRQRIAQTDQEMAIKRRFGTGI